MITRSVPGLNISQVVTNKDFLGRFRPGISKVVRYDLGVVGS